MKEESEIEKENPNLIKTNSQTTKKHPAQLKTTAAAPPAATTTITVVNCRTVAMPTICSRFLLILIS